MKTKIFTLFLALAASVGTIYADFDHSNCIQIGELYYFLDTENKTAEVTEGGDYYYSGDIVIPPSVVYNTETYGVTTIGVGAFRYCFGLTSIEIPNSVTSIGESTFVGCSGLTTITVENGNATYNSRNNCNAIIETASNTLIAGCKNTIIPNNVTSIGIEAFGRCTELTSINIPNSVISIGEGAFDFCSGLTSITIPYSVTSIGDCAFYDCYGLTSITCYAVIPPIFYNMYVGGVFHKVDKSIPLYVPAGSINAYKSADQWKEFTNILPISAIETETTDVKTTTTENSVDVTWPAVDGAYTYELVIRDKNGNVVCTLIFNAQGQLMSITFNAPSRDGAPQQTQSAGFAFTVTGLDSGTEYDLTITAKDENGQEIDKKNMSFQTDGTQGLDDINTNIKSSKILHDNQVLILRGDKTYTLQGQEVK